MITRSRAARKKRLVKKYLPVMLLGTDCDAFISNRAWIPNLLATDCFYLQYLVAQDRARAEELEDEYPDAFVYPMEHDPDPAPDGEHYRKAVQDAYREFGDSLVVAICTPDHFEQIKFCLEVGVKCLLVDKPPVNTCREWAEIQALADERGALILVSFQHELNSPTDEMAERVAEHAAKYGAASVTLHGFFNQGWLLDGPDNWRINVLYGGLKDIATHAASGLCRLAGSWIAKVLKSEHRKGRRAKLEAAALDNGEVDIEFANGIRGYVSYTQVDPRYTDDIGWLAVLTNPETGAVTKLLWRMNWGAAEVLYIGDENSSLDDIGTWTPHQRSHSAEIRSEANAVNDKQPPGHTMGWSDMWYVFFLRAYQRFLALIGEKELAEGLVDMAYGHCPDFKYAGKSCLLFVGASERCFEQKRPVETAEIAAEHGMVPNTPPSVTFAPPTAAA